VPLGDHIGNVGDALAEDERQPGRLDLFLVRLAHHPRISHDRDVGQLMSGHERLDHRQHDLSLGLVPLERGDHQREPGPTAMVSTLRPGPGWTTDVFAAKASISASLSSRSPVIVRSGPCVASVYVTTVGAAFVPHAGGSGDDHSARTRHPGLNA
jgi:hypothetical protein